MPKKNLQIKNLHRHLKRAAASFDSRPMLKAVHYDADGSISVTDSHRLLRIAGFHNHKEEFNQDLSTVMLLDGNYPDTSRLIPEKFSTEITISLSVLIRIMKALGTSAEECVRWKLLEHKIIFSNLSDKINYGEPVEVTANAKIEGDLFDISFKAKYVRECCEFFMDAKERYAIDDVTIKMTSPIRPAVFTIDESKYIYLVTPVRIN